jgi:hypothetical protein
MGAIFRKIMTPEQERYCEKYQTKANGTKDGNNNFRISPAVN